MNAAMDSTQFRHAMGHFATGITVVTSRDKAGQPYGLTVNSFASLSLHPPLVHWALKETSFAWPIFSEAGMFAVNILAAGQEAISHNFCRPLDRFAGLDWEEGLNGLPLIRGCLAWVECARDRILEGGDHWIMVGRVVRARTFDRMPLVYWRGTYMPIHDINRSGGGL
jgi:flavin reductase (DIM6/NTAB) family NADH-FMN oxidoreductase RutF